MGCTQGFPGYHAGESLSYFYCGLTSLLLCSTDSTCIPTATLTRKDTHPLQCTSFLPWSQIQWEEYQEEHPEMVHIVQPGLDKLADYCTHAGLVPVYMLAMGMLTISMLITWSYLPIQIAIDPSQKLDWFQKHMPEEYGEAKAIFVQAVHICWLV